MVDWSQPLELDDGTPVVRAERSNTGWRVYPASGHSHPHFKNNTSRLFTTSGRSTSSVPGATVRNRVAAQAVIDWSKPVETFSGHLLTVDYSCREYANCSLANPDDYRNDPLFSGRYDSRTFMTDTGKTQVSPHGGCRNVIENRAIDYTKPIRIIKQPQRKVVVTGMFEPLDGSGRYLVVRVPDGSNSALHVDAITGKVVPQSPGDSRGSSLVFENVPPVRTVAVPFREGNLYPGSMIESDDQIITLKIEGDRLIGVELTR